MALVAGNKRNGAATSSPPVMESMDGTCQFGVLIDALWHLWVWRRVLPTAGHTADDRWAFFDLSTDSTVSTAGLGIINPDPPDGTGDDHWGACLGVDSQDRLHVTGNMHSSQSYGGKSTQRYVYSDAIDTDPANTTPFSGVTWHNPAYQFASTGANSHVYNIFVRTSAGVLLWFMSQDDRTTNTLGRDWIAAQLPVGTGTAWKSLYNASTNGAVMVSSAANVTDGSEANRVYINGVVITPAHDDVPERIHVYGVFRLNDNKPGSTQDPAVNPNDNYVNDPPALGQQAPWYIRGDLPGLLDGTRSWRTVLGAAFSAPVTWQNRGPIEITSAPPFSRNMGGMAIDHLDQPHMTMQYQDSTTFVRCWYDFALGGWQTTNLALAGASLGGTLMRLRDDILFITTKDGRIRVENNAGNAGLLQFYMGGPAWNGWTSIPEPEAAKRNLLSLLIPDGDTALMWEFGQHVPFDDRGISLHLSHAETADGTGPTLDRSNHTEMQWAALDVTAYSGFTNVVFTIEDSLDNINWATIATFTTVTGTGNEKIDIPVVSRRFVRIRWVVTGAGSITFSAVGMAV